MFSHNGPKTLIFDALLLGKAGFLMTHQRGAKLLHYYMKSRFSNDPPKTLILDALLRGKAGFIMT